MSEEMIEGLKAQIEGLKGQIEGLKGQIEGIRAQLENYKAAEMTMPPHVKQRFMGNMIRAVDKEGQL